MIVLGCVVINCATSEFPTPTAPVNYVSPAVGDDSCSTTLCCTECELESVLGIQNGEQLSIPAGTSRMYGAVVDVQVEPCASAAYLRMSELAGAQVRIERVVSTDVDRAGRRVAYLFTVEGDSIDEIMVREGLARAWDQDGQHHGWLVYRQSVAASTDSGCIWSLGPLGR